VERVHRPKRVVIVDADDPMVEVQGEFFWVEDHQRILAVQREAAYRDGYSAGWDAASRPIVAPVIVRPPRTPVRSAVRALWLLLAAWLMVLFLVSLFAH
jgi:hypothetical protein